MPSSALQVARTGLEAQDQRMRVIANNLANVGTTAFKRDRANFATLAYQDTRVAGADSSTETTYATGLNLGTGVAIALTADAERLLAARGVRTAWLACAIGNDRAARFYEKCGWRRVGTMVHRAETSDGVFPLEAWRFEKDLRT